MPAQSFKNHLAKEKKKLWIFIFQRFHVIQNALALFKEENIIAERSIIKCCTKCKLVCEVCVGKDQRAVSVCCVCVCVSV